MLRRGLNFQLGIFSTSRSVKLIAPCVTPAYAKMISLVRDRRLLALHTDMVVGPEDLGIDVGVVRRAAKQ
jgi:hypothetical protein